MIPPIAEYKKYVSDYFGLVVLGILLMMVIILGYYGFYPPEFLSAYGTILLVIVTLGYVIQNAKMVKSMEAERRLNEDTLKEMQKGPRIMVISHGIDEILEELKKDQDGWEDLEPIDECTPLPGFRPHDFPDEGTINDIEPKYEGVTEKIDRYLELRSLYTDKRQDIFDDIKSHIEDEVAPSLADEPEGALTRIAHDANMDDAQEYIEHHSGNLAGSVLNLRFEGGLNAPGSVFELRKEVFLGLRDEAQFESQIDELVELMSELKPRNEELTTNLRSARRQFKEEFDIKEPEISESRQSLIERRRARNRELRDRVKW